MLHAPMRLLGEVVSQRDVQRKETTMSAILLERTIAATPERVFAALTQQDELARWWTNDLSVTARVGSLAEFRFRQGAIVRQLEVAELVLGQRVRWFVHQSPEPWAGTTVTWRLTPVPSGTRAVFTQDGFAEADALYARTVVEWNFYLDSLKAYLEMGSGCPYVRGELDPE